MKKAILAGKNEFGHKLVEVDINKLNQEERKFLSSCNDGYWKKDDKGAYLGTHAQILPQSIAEATEETVISSIQELTRIENEQKEEERKKRENAIKRILETDTEKLISCDYNNWFIVIKEVEDPSLNQKYQEAQNLAKIKNDKVDANRKHKEEQEAMEKKKKQEQIENQKKEKQQQIALWVSNFGTESQKSDTRPDYFQKRKYMIL